jgi:POT family proton-dependent oligopeptide transporter
MATGAAVAGTKGAAARSGHPKGLYYLAFTEAWERFSYYGMTGLLVLYMVNQLLLPGHVENIAGFEGFRGFVEGLYGPLSTQELASAIFGLYAGFVYFTPVLGGLVADRWIGERNAVVIGALCMTGGHLAMTFDESFLLALLLLVIGSGFLKGNISAQVGALYPRDDEAGRARGFVTFSTAINIGAVAGPVLCGFLATRYGWHWGFGVAAIFMVGGLLTYLAGYRHLPARTGRIERVREPLAPGDAKRIAAIVAILAITTLHSLSYDQLFNVLPVWVQEHVDLSAGGFEIPIPWFQSADSLASILCVPLLLATWARMGRRGAEPGDMGKLVLGGLVIMAANLILVVGMLVAGDGKVSAVWPLLYCLCTGTSFMIWWPTMLALVSRAAPVAINSTMMGVVFLNPFVAGVGTGWIGTHYKALGPVAFWLLNAGIALAGTLLVLLAAKPLGRVLAASTTR